MSIISFKKMGFLIKSAKMKRSIYLDNGMTAKPSQEAISQMIPFYSHKWGTPSQPHQMGQELFLPLTESLKRLYHAVGAKEEHQFVFTSSGAEAINQVVFSAYHEITLPTGKNHFITSAIEEAPSLMSISRLEKMGCSATLIKPNQHGIITLQALTEAMTPRTALVSLSWASGLTGVIQPIQELAPLCKKRGVKFHVDITHAMGKLACDFSELDIDFLTFNGDPFHAPQGTGGLFVKAGVSVSPLILGGIEQAGHRAGTFSVPGLVGLGYAAREAIDNRDFLGTEIARLRSQFEKGIVSNIPEANLLFSEEERLPNCSAIAFPGVANEALLFALNRKQLFASIGGGNFQQIGYVLTGCGHPENVAATAVSFNLSRETTEDEIDRAVDIIAETYFKLRKTSQFI
jgi:cysteine desulfurase